MNHGDENLLETLLDVTQKILTAEQLQDALDAIARAVSTLFAFRFVSIVAADSPDQDMTRRVMLGWNEETKAKRIGESISRSAARDFLAAEFEVYPNCYYFPAERFIEWKHIIYAGAGKNDEARSTPDSWHQNDSIALVLADHLGAMLGYISIDAPEDGLVPERTTLKRMRLFADLVGLALANARARAAEEARARLLEDQARTQSDFLGVVSHEFRSPLAAIRGAATLLETSAERLPEIRRRELLQTIAASTVRMSTLFDDFLLLSRVDAGSLRLVEEIVDPQVVVDESLGRLRSEHPARPCSISVPQQCDGVRGDPTRIVQVLANLLSNAVRYSTPRSSIHIAVESIRDFVHFSVRNSGPGIPEGLRARLFTRFGQFGNHPEATGLGLYLSRQLVELMGGHIDFDSLPNESTTFWFSLPIAREGKSTEKKTLHR